MTDRYAQLHSSVIVIVSRVIERVALVLSIVLEKGASLQS